MAATDHERCEQCHFDGGTFDDAALLAALRGLGPRWRALLGTAGDHLRTRPAPEVWSALEYAAHSRDITALHAFGVEQAVRRDEPVFPAVDPGLADQAAVSYVTEDVSSVLDALDEHTHRLAGAAEGADWSRGLTLGTERSTIRWLLEHALHDSVHHLDDVERGLAELSKS